MRLRLAIASCLIAAAAPAASAQTFELTVELETTETGDSPTAPDFYGPNDHVLAVWVEDDQGGFVKTIERQSGVRTVHLITWGAASGGSSVDTDAVSGATRSSHAGVVTTTWDLTDRDGAAVADGTYTIRMEVADENTNDGAPPDPTANNLGTFTVVLDGTAKSDPGQSDGGFNNVNVEVAEAVGGDGDGDGDSPPTIVGGCATGGGSSSAGWALILLGFVLMRTRWR